MAGKRVPATRIITVTYKQADSYLAAHQAERPCEACGATEWKLTTHADDLVVHVFMELSFTNDHIGYVPVSCGNCQNTRFFNSIAIVDWIDKQAKEGGENG